MPAYLLSPPVLMNLLLGRNAQDAKVVTWLQARRDDDDFYVSEIAVGQLLAMARKRGAFSEDERDKWLHKLTTEVPLQFGGRYLPISREVINDWSKFKFEAANGDEILSTVMGLDLAVARVNNLTYVVRSAPSLQLHHSKLDDPWT